MQTENWSDTRIFILLNVGSSVFDFDVIVLYSPTFVITFYINVRRFMVFN